MPLFILAFFLIVPALAQSANFVEVPKASLSSTSLVNPGNRINLGKDVRRGVEAQVYLESQQQLDINQPLQGDLHHFLISVVFTDVRTKKNIREGEVAARTILPSGRSKATTIRLEIQGNSWTGMLALPSAGETTIKLGSKLPDGKKRIYSYFYNPKPSLPADIGSIPGG